MTNFKKLNFKIVFKIYPQKFLSFEKHFDEITIVFDSKFICKQIFLRMKQIKLVYRLRLIYKHL
jgi:hypothetical protein